MPPKFKRNQNEVKPSPQNVTPVLSSNEVPVTPTNTGEPRFVDLSRLGMRDIEVFRESPKVVREVGGVKVVDYVQEVIKEHNVEQPILTLEEVRVIGKNPPGGWHPYKHDKNLFTCVVNFRRFLVTADVYGALVAG